MHKVKVTLYMVNRLMNHSRLPVGLFVLLLGTTNIVNAEEDKATRKSSISVSSLMTQIAKTNVTSYRFSEKKFYSFLKKPTEVSGDLVFKKPDTLEKNIVTNNKKASYRIVGDKLFITKPNKKIRKVLLNNYPEILALANSLRALFAGRVDVLKQFFEIEINGTLQSWTLILTPTDIDLEEKIEFMEIKGEHLSLKKITIKETDGDKSILTLSGW